VYCKVRQQAHTGYLRVAVLAASMVVSLQIGSKGFLDKSAKTALRQVLRHDRFTWRA
jgi:hypothetical protein